MNLLQLLLCLAFLPIAAFSRDSATTWGAYIGRPVQTAWDESGRTMHLLSELRYTDPSGEEWIAPKNWKIDGASIPRAFWSIIGGPFEGPYREGSVLPDVACDQRTRTWKDAARMFYTAMRCSGVNQAKAKTMYYAVYTFGPHWHQANAFERLLHPRLSADETVAIMPRQPSEAQARRIYEWIKRSNPTLGEIENHVE